MRCCHIVGNSRSILEEPKLPNLHPTIGINRILRLFQPDYLMIVDAGVREEEWDRIRKYKGKIISYVGLKKWGRKVISFDVDDAEWRMRGWGPKYARTGNTGHYAIEWAARQMRRKGGKILLHGMDFCSRPGQPSHFYGDGSKQKHPTSQQAWNQHLRAIGKTVKFLRDHNIRVLNASPWTNTPLHVVVPHA